MTPVLVSLITLLLLPLVLPGQPQVQAEGRGITSGEENGSVLWTGFSCSSDPFQELPRF